MDSIESHQSEDDGHLFADEKFSLVRRLERTKAQITRCVCEKTRLWTCTVRKRVRLVRPRSLREPRSARTSHPQVLRVERARTRIWYAAVRGRALLSRYSDRTPHATIEKQ